MMLHDKNCFAQNHEAKNEFFDNLVLCCIKLHCLR